MTRKKISPVIPDPFKNTKTMKDILFEIGSFVRQFWYVLLLYLMACIAFACVFPYLIKKVDEGLKKMDNIICPCKK